MKVAFVVIRYGQEFVGGGELLARLLAEHLASRIDVEVLTTCAADLMTWAGRYPPGRETINGIPVRRFPVALERDMQHFGQLGARVINQPHTYYDEVQWMRSQGPHSPEMTHYIREHEGSYDLFVFFSYLYATTFTGLQLVSHKSVLLPTAHDEPWLYLDIFRPIFHLPRGFIFLSDEERDLVHRVFHNEHIPGETLGMGVEVPEPVTPAFGLLSGDYLLYMGRIDEGKGCDELIRNYLAYKESTTDSLKLVLIGPVGMEIPKHPDIVPLGFLPGNERFAWLKHSMVLVLPSQFESFSISTMEAWGMGVPTLVNGHSAVLRGHSRRSNGGLYYDTQEEFIEALKLLRANKDLRNRLGIQGQCYVHQRYNWASVTLYYERFLYRMLDTAASARSHSISDAHATALDS